MQDNAIFLQTLARSRKIPARNALRCKKLPNVWFLAIFLQLSSKKCIACKDLAGKICTCKIFAKITLTWKNLTRSPFFGKSCEIFGRDVFFSQLETPQTNYYTVVRDLKNCSFCRLSLNSLFLFTVFAIKKSFNGTRLLSLRAHHIQVSEHGCFRNGSIKICSSVKENVGSQENFQSFGGRSKIFFSLWMAAMNGCYGWLCKKASEGQIQ